MPSFGSGAWGAITRAVSGLLVVPEVGLLKPLLVALVVRGQSWRHLDGHVEMIESVSDRGGGDATIPRIA